jgi:starch-binding outer membrane protein, SusD/RagB family
MNIMKTRLLVRTLALSLLCVACTDLQIEENDSIVDQTAGSGAGTIDPTEGLVAAYKDLSAYTDQANVYALFEHTTDEMIPPTRGVDWSDNGVWRSLYTHTWDPTHAYILGAWNQIHQRAFKASQILGSSPSAAQAAQAKFLRAFHMWYALDLFGQVPFRDIDDDVNDNPIVMSRSEAFDFVIKDLEEALPGLDNGGPIATNSKATKAAAYTLLARLYLNKAVYKAANPEGPYTFDVADMNKVIQYCDLVTAAGYSLQNEYFKNFSNTADTEVIFTTAEGTPQNRWFMTLHYNQNPSGWNGFTTLADFYNKFEDGDQRKGIPADPDGSNFSAIGRGFLIGNQFKDDGTPLIDTRTQKQLSFTTDVPLSGAATDKGIRVIKYHPANNGQYIFYRYGDVFLMKAEAVMRGGTDPGGKTALQLVNELRDVRGASALASLDEEAMLDERGRELYWEGIRRVDLVRFGAFARTWSEKTNTESFRVLFPIPQQALDSNPNLVPNPGY